MEKASLKQRGSAGALDLLLTILLLGWLAMGITLALAGNLTSPLLIELDALLLSGYWLLDATPRGTLGKRLFRVRVAQADGQPASVTRRLARTLFKSLPLIGGPTFGMALIVASQQRTAPGEIPVVLLLTSTISGMLYLFAFIDSVLVFSARRQALHDMITKTAVFAVPR